MDVSEALGKIKEHSEELFDVVSSKFTDLNEENKERRTKNKSLSDNLGNLVSKFDLNQDEDIVSQLSNIIQSKDQKNQQSLTDVEKLSLQVQELNNKYVESEKKAQESANKAILAKRDNQLQSALIETNVSKDLLPLVKDSLEKKISINGDQIIFSDGEQTFNSIQEGVTSYIDSNPHLQSISNTGGSGEQNNGNQNGNSKTITRDQFSQNLEAIAKGEKVVSN